MSIAIGSTMYTLDILKFGGSSSGKINKGPKGSLVSEVSSSLALDDPGSLWFLRVIDITSTKNDLEEFGRLQLWMNEIQCEVMA